MSAAVTPAPPGPEGRRPSPTAERESAWRLALTIARFGRAHRPAFVKGVLAAALVVAARLALPWPIDGLMSHWKEAHPSDASFVPGVPWPVVLGVALLGVLGALGLGDGLERLWFARFAIGTVRDIRQAALDASLGGAAGLRATPAGDVVARLVGDAARLKAGLKGLLVHVATNGILYVGVTAVLLRVDLHLGLVFGAAGLGTAVATFLGGRAILVRASKYRRKEGDLAVNIDRAVRRGRWNEAFDGLNARSGDHEASITRIQSVTTWTTYVLFGLAVVAATWTGSRAIASGELDPRAMLVFLLYALVIRGPMVRLARQGSRLGKVLASADRLIHLVAARPEEARASARSPLQGGVAPRGVVPVMKDPSRVRVLFTGYAPVHFLCFRPLYERLRATPGVEVSLSGGIEVSTDHGIHHDHAAMYAPLGVPMDHVLPVDSIRGQDFDFLFAGNTTLISPRHATTKVQIFHGVSFRNRGIRPANMGCDYYFVVGPYMQRRFAEIGLMSEDDPRALKIGFMKTDRLVDGSLDRRQVLGGLRLAGDLPVVLFAPTGQKHNALEVMGEDVIDRIVSSGRFDLVVKPHDHPRDKDIDWFARLSRFEGPRCRITRELDVIPLLFAADVLLSDASSVSNEYSLLDRPVTFLDVPDLLAKAAAKKDALVDLDTWGRKGGRVAAGPDDVVAALADSLATPGELSHVRRVQARDLFYNPGRATDAAFSWFRSVASPRAGAAAPGPA